MTETCQVQEKRVFTVIDQNLEISKLSLLVTWEMRKEENLN